MQSKCYTSKLWQRDTPWRERALHLHKKTEKPRYLVIPCTYQEKCDLTLKVHLRGGSRAVPWQNQEADSSLSTLPLSSKWTPETLSCFTQHCLALGPPISTCFHYFRPKYFLTSDSSPRIFLWSILLGHNSIVAGTNLVKTSMFINLDYDIHFRGRLCVTKWTSRNKTLHERSDFYLQRFHT